MSIEIMMDLLLMIEEAPTTTADSNETRHQPKYDSHMSLRWVSKWLRISLRSIWDFVESHEILNWEVTVFGHESKRNFQQDLKEIR